MSKEIHLCLFKLQLFRVQAFVFASGLEHFAEGLVVLRFGLATYHNVVSNTHYIRDVFVCLVKFVLEDVL